MGCVTDVLNNLTEKETRQHEAIILIPRVLALTARDVIWKLVIVSSTFNDNKTLEQVRVPQSMEAFAERRTGVSSASTLQADEGPGVRCNCRYEDSLRGAEGLVKTRYLLC